MEISILILTYNHEKFIGQALDSVMAQIIDVPFEILICDDASTDKTQSILREYQKRAPHMIKLYLRKRNGCNPTKYYYHLLSKARGRYIAALEGDDYWLDPQKLKKQYECMENHPEYSACIGENLYVDENGDDFDESEAWVRYPNCVDNLFTLKDFSMGFLPGPSAAFFARNYFDSEKYKIIYKAHNMVGDHTIYMLSLLKGNIYQMPEKLSVRRIRRKEGETNFNSINVNNKYLRYSRLCLTVRLESYLRENYSHNFNIQYIANNFSSICHDLPIASVVRIILMSQNKRRYLKYAMIMYLLSSNYVSEIGKGKGSLPYNMGKLSVKNKRIVIFGAGECAKEYLDQEGWREFTLFVVDNDCEKWGKSFKGYLIKKPELIVPIKDKVVVLIANYHHENEIARQLEAMGICDYYSYRAMKQKELRNILAIKIQKSLEK